jgi:hypothetical protein
MKSIFIVLIISILIISCSNPPSENIIQTAIAQTQASFPSPTSIPTNTPIPLSEVDLESILYLSGDLPSEFLAEQIKYDLPKYFSGRPKADQVIQQEFRSGKFSSDGVIILLYSSLSDLEAAYKIAIKEVKSNPLTLYSPNIGENLVITREKIAAIILSGGGGLPETVDIKLVFTRCNALIFVDLFGANLDEDIVTSYAQRLDKRISKLICQ